MKKRFTKIICAALASVVAVGAAAIAGCAEYYDRDPLPGNYSSGEVMSNGGFAVDKGDYIYFINGIQGYTADNEFGNPVRGSVMRISKENFDNRNYSAVQTVVPLISYSGSNAGGIFIYGNYIYYSTPSTEKNADGEVLNSNLDMKRTKLDGTETMKDPFIQFSSNGMPFRYVEENGTVYLLYVATGEKLYGESSGVTNIHSLNTSTGVNTLLAYNISSYLFDDKDKTNPRVYYTMNVRNYAADTNYSYNQVYSVTASCTVRNNYDTSKVIGWDDDDRYINCGTLIFDGIGKPTAEKTPFNYEPENADSKNNYEFQYTLKKYVGGYLFYTRHTSNNSIDHLFALKDEDVAYDGSWNAVTSNPEQDPSEGAGEWLLDDGSVAGGYTYLFTPEGELSGIMIAESSGGITVNKLVDGKLQNKIGYNPDSYYYYVVQAKEGTATIIDVQGDYVYYSLSTASPSGYAFYRVNWRGEWEDYNGFVSEEEDSGVADYYKYKSVRIYDLDSASDWYAPEFIRGQILFPSETDNMDLYNYVMVCDLRAEDADGFVKDGDDYVVMNNSELNEKTELYNKVIDSDGIISDFADSDKYDQTEYAHLSSALKYLFYTGDVSYVNELAAAVNAEVADGDDAVYSANTLKKIEEFMAPETSADWADFTDFRTVSGEKVYANRRDYYYSVLGRMSDSDARNYRSSLRSEYLEKYPEASSATWWEGLSAGAKAGFIIGMCFAGLLAIGLVTIGVWFIVRRFGKKKNEPQIRRRRIKVDTTDDKSIDVYGDGESSPSEEESKPSDGTEN